ncbi:LOW QUALITY PROTEIN: protein artichoke-like [Galleria mellonella]|uniref:LOW QUALITY PROTEIN: protein artichoke-like n=1 Tax=Galleria mellonella TaxID=7137 RepID=A0A6J1WF46_GALME|nr:LOW QUALITY PROTEIN: protein artichoke-like [Galleria mellonella]
MDFKNLALFLFLISIINGTKSDHEGFCIFTEFDTSPCIGNVVCDGNRIYRYAYDSIRSWSCLNNHYYNRGRYYNSYDSQNSRLDSDYYQIYLKIYNLKSKSSDGIPLNKDSSILPTQIPKSNIKSLEVTNCEMVSLPDEVYNLPKITQIQVSHNDLTTINLLNFAKNYNLLKINASNNVITELDDSHMSTIDLVRNGNIISLIDLSHNLISEIPNNHFKNFDNLLHLNLSHNNINSFEILTFEGLSKLQTLYLSNNKLKDIGHTLMRFSDLLDLTLDNNEITVIIEPNFKVMSKLEKLNLSSNVIQDIEETAFQNLSDLQVLDLSNNKITFLSNIFFKNNNKLKTVYISYNAFTTIPSEIFSGKAIEQFHMFNNNITGVIDSTMFNGICEPNLDLSNNKILAIKSVIYKNCIYPIESLNFSKNIIHNISQEAFKTLESLVDLDLSYNNLNYIDFNISYLNKLEIYVSHNQIKKITKLVLKNLTSLKILDLSQNAIIEIENNSFDDLLSLETLYLNDNLFTNSLKSHIFQKLVALKDLNIMNTRTFTYENETFSGMTSLKVLNSSYGELSTLDYAAFKNTGSLEILDLSHNILEKFFIDTASIASVNKLYLNNNKIRTISKETFYGLTNIDTVFLENNNIVSLDADSFTSLTKLSHVYLDHNEELVLNGTEFDNLSSLVHVSFKSVKKHFNFQSSKNTTINKLDLSYCGITEIYPLFIYKIKRMSYLNLSSNKIKFIDKHSFQSMPYLTVLDMSSNLITSIQPGSFLHTKEIRSLNLYGNDIPSLQYGVFDGLENMHELNLSSNSLHSFEVNLLHKSPAVAIISLNDNLIEKINFDKFMDTHVKKLFIGGNIIPCNDLIKLKAQDLGELEITAEILDYHSENVDGVTCRTDLVKTNYQTPNNNILSNITTAFDTLSNAMEIFRNTIQNFANRNIVDTDEIQKNMKEVLNSINKLIKVYNESQTTTNNYLKQLLEKDNAQIIVREHVKSDKKEVRNSNIPIYVTLACLVVLLGLCGFFIYSYYKWRNRLNNDRIMPSVQHLTNDVIEMD